LKSNTEIILSKLRFGMDKSSTIFIDGVKSPLQSPPAREIADV